MADGVLFLEGGGLMGLGNFSELEFVSGNYRLCVFSP